MTSTTIGGSYATLAELKLWKGVPDANTGQDAELTSRILSASRDIDRWCHRVFGRDEVASARVFRPDRSGISTDDFWTTTDLAVTPYLGGTAGAAWDVTLLTLEPLNGVVDGLPGWPYGRLCSGFGGSGTHPLWANMFFSASTVQVTAKWGWEAIPDNVVTACLMLASMDSKGKETPFGVAGFGDYAVRIRSNPMAQEKLDPYVKGGTSANSFMAAS